MRRAVAVALFLIAPNLAHADEPVAPATEAAAAPTSPDPVDVDDTVADPDAEGHRVPAPGSLARPWRATIGAGGGPLLSGEGDRSRWRGHAELDFFPGGGLGRFGGGVAVRAFDRDGGMVTASVLYEAAASRPLLVLNLHADAGYAWDAEAPVTGVGLQTQLGIIGPLGVISDVSGHLIVDDVLDPTLMFSMSLRVALIR